MSGRSVETRSLAWSGSLASVRERDKRDRVDIDMTVPDGESERAGYEREGLVDRTFGLTGFGHRVNRILEKRWRDIFDGYVTGPVGEPVGPHVAVSAKCCRRPAAAFQQDDMGLDEIAEQSLAAGCSGDEHDEFGFGVDAAAFHRLRDPAVVSGRDDLPHAGFAFLERAGSFPSACRCNPGGPFVRVGWRVDVDRIGLRVESGRSVDADVWREFGWQRRRVALASFFDFCEDVTKRARPRLGPEVFDPHAPRFRGARHHQHGCGDRAVVKFPSYSSSGCQASSDPELWRPGRITGAGPDQMAVAFFDFGVMTRLGTRLF